MLLLHAPDGRLRLRHLLQLFAPDYDLLLIDTQGARSVLIEMAVLASDIALCPVTPEFLGARELQRGTLQLVRELAPFRHWGIAPPPLVLLLNRMHAVSCNARVIRSSLQRLYQNDVGVKLLETVVPAIEAYPRASMMSLPVHRVERHKAKARVAPTALDTMRTLACELFPEWASRIARVTGTASDAEFGRG
jgi:chromosome partitioning related protein ParA